MLKQYFKQALQMLKDNPLVNAISIMGTSLSIAMIMVIVLVFQINNANYAPESARDRMLYVLGTEVYCESKTTRTRGGMSEEVVKECFYALQRPEAVTACSKSERPVSLPGERLFAEYNINYTDPGCWKVFDFTFIHGAPFTESDFLSGMPRAVVSAETARKLFGITEVVGKEIVIDYVSYSITGVVKTVSSGARFAYADIWVPYRSKPGLIAYDMHYEGGSGSFRTILLARSPADFEAVKSELNAQLAVYNTAKEDCKVNFLSNPIDQLDLTMGSGGFQKVSFKSYFLSTGSVLLFLLLIPAMNLIGIVQSSVQKRKGEIGLRKAFGATWGKLIGQVLFENMVITCIGALIGLMLSFLFLHLGKSFILNEDMMLTADMLFKPGLFLAVLFFALLLNLLSAGLPALYTARQQIVAALNDTNQ
ncbi:ABC transporter permease [Parabacteroides sp. PF5-9]|uniref:ABC transporter permease n=1 Tax=Parabacteroides sp. PF5-9 TaxID=1742404 RepID=UPI002476E0B4|nr:ABC transporter permease [Parabacteroides sp. PF5-9]MDH6357821.1 putative ABC transport system permease protein [Parabacteroides sp. PF5-9]